MSVKSKIAQDRTWRLVIVGLLLTALAWTLNAWIDARFDAALFLHEVFHPEPKHLLIRIVFVATQGAFLVYIALLFKRRRRLEKELLIALRQKEEEHRKNEAVLESFGDPISIQDRELRVIYQNVAHRELMGDHRGELCYSAYQKRDTACPACHLERSFADGKVHRRETSNENSTKGHIDVEVVSTPLVNADGEIFAAIESVRDVTERKRAEATIRRISSDLEQRTRELSAANAELEAFGSTLAHDIRSFLARISTAAETLQQVGGGGQLCADGRYCVDTIGTACDGMEQLIDSIMLLSLISHRGMQRQSVDLSAFAAEIALELQARAPERNVEFDIDPGLVAEGDPGLLRIAVENLLANAWKYSRDANPARIRFSRREEGGRQFFCIEDNGVGFDMQEVDRLFRPFGRLGSGRNFPGVGIGLTTVKRIVVRHGGDIHATGTPGSGARFCFSFGT